MRAAIAALPRPLLPPARLRPHLLIGVGAFLVLLCIYMFWLRDCWLVKVEHVSIRGLTESPQLREQLAQEARTMTTLHVDHDGLDNVVAGYPAVERVEVDADLPHTLRIDVIERQPAAVLVSGRTRMPVAGDGRLLRGLRTSASLPVIKLSGALPGERLGPGTPLREAEVAGAAPLALRRRLSTVIETKDRGLVARLRKGPDVVFGSARQLSVKWLAAARVLADSGSRGADYVDVRLPERPVAGGLPVDETQAPPEPVTTTPAAPATTAPAAPSTTAPASPTNP
ncbi:MAG TPA: FtsQ-type POTRA domain-containing protein [Thermoleophilaceae bacterium]|jgi:cell division protein FtsQ